MKRSSGLVALLLVVAVSLIGCSTTAPLPTPGPTTTAVTATTNPATTTTTERAGQPHKSGSAVAPCTDRIDYAGDPRSNAEINSIGERTGTCPPVEKHTPAPATGLPNDPNVSCTNRINYSGDPRSNAEINSIGVDTGTCPAPQH